MSRRKMLAVFSRLKSNSAAMALGSIIFQGTSFLALAILKSSIPVDVFAYFITQLSVASIVGAIATLRFELLLFQERGHVDKESLFSTFIISLIVLSFCGISIVLISGLAGASLNISPMSLVLAFGFGMIEAQSFLCVQMNRVAELVITRVAQAIALGITALLVWSGIYQEVLFTLYALGVALPLGIWFIVAIVRAPGSLVLHVPPFAVWKRSIALTLAALVNTVYANLPVVLASATQSAVFVADFGFIMRLLTGPITLIRQAYGHTYLANAFRLERESDAPAADIWRLTWGAIVQSISTYLVILFCVILVLFSLNDLFKISQPWMILILAWVTIGQVGINTVANIRTPIKRELSFLKFDSARVIILSVSLLSLSKFEFDIVFTVVSSALYICYVAFIRLQIKRSAVQLEAGPRTI